MAPQPPNDKKNNDSNANGTMPGGEPPTAPAAPPPQATQATPVIVAPATPQPPLRGFHDLFISRELRKEILEAYSEQWEDTPNSGNIRLVTDGQGAFAIVPNRHGNWIFNRVEWGFGHEVPAAAWRQIEAWLTENPEPPRLTQHRVTLDDQQIEMLRRAVHRDDRDYLYTFNRTPPTYEAMSLDGETYALSSGGVFQWTDHPRPEFIPAGYERGEQIKRWLIDHPQPREEPVKATPDKDAEALEVLHEIVDPQGDAGILQSDAVRAAKLRGVSVNRAMRLLKDPKHFRFAQGKSKKEGNWIFVRVLEKEDAGC